MSYSDLMEHSQQWIKENYGTTQVQTNDFDSNEFSHVGKDKKFMDDFILEIPLPDFVGELMDVTRTKIRFQNCHNGRWAFRGYEDSKVLAYHLLKMFKKSNFIKFRSLHLDSLEIEYSIEKIEDEKEVKYRFMKVSHNHFRFRVIIPKEERGLRTDIVELNENTFQNEVSPGIDPIGMVVKTYKFIKGPEDSSVLIRIKKRPLLVEEC